MANILSLAMKISADASGVVKNLTPAERALENLGKQAEKLTSVFDQFANDSAAAGAAQANTKAAIDALTASLQAGTIAPAKFAEEYAKLGAAVEKEAAAFRRAREITQANLSPLQRYEQAVGELREQLNAGRISQETYDRALAKAKTTLDGTASSANKADKSLESLTKNTQLLARIEIGRLVLDGVQALGNAFTSVTNQITSLVGSVNSSLDQLNDFSARTGIGVEALQSYSLAAKLAGVDTEQFGAAVQKLTVNIGKAAPGDALDKSLRNINLSVVELRALSPEEQFSAIGDAISQLPTAADRAAAAVQIFGKQGAALAPLFREGAASIEELQARAERLGIIVSEQQVGNVADMNDAFDLVSATIQGIIGQVIGNLAPAVTAVTEEFLRFVEEWSGAQGEGGTGIANAITETLLRGAEIFAGVFDSFMASFGGFNVQIKDLSSSFTFAANIFQAVSAGLTAAFNVFELAGNALAMALGKLLEAVGSYVSSDLEQYGKDLQEQTRRASEENARQLTEAAASAANAVQNAFTGGEASPQAAGQGAATEFIAGIRERFERESAPEYKIATNIDDLRERFDNFFGGIVDNSSDITNAMREFEAVVAAAQADTELTAEEIKAIEEAQKRVNDLIDQESRNRQEGIDAINAQAEADQKRIDNLLEKNDASVKLEQDLLAVQREQARVSEQLAAARADGVQADADAAAARQAELDQLQAKLEEQQQALEQGFGQGFEAAFANVDNTINGLIEKSTEFGQAGFDAAQRLQDGIAQAKQEAKDGILNQEAFERQVQQQQELFNQEIENIQKAAAERKRVEDAVNQLLFQNLTPDQQARVKAAENVRTIEQEIAAVQQKVKEAQAANDQKAVEAGAQRLEQLNQVAEKERRIADGRAELEQQQAKQREQFLKAYEQQQQAAQKAAEQAAQEQQRIAEERQKAIEAEVKRQEERISALNTLGSRQVNTADIRTSQGAALVLNLAAEAQDPALIQARIQTKYLQQIALGIGSAASNYLNAPVSIVGYSQLGGVP